VGIDTGDMHLKNYCGECLELLGMVPDSHGSLTNRGNSSVDKSYISGMVNKNHDNTSNENKQINVSMLKKDDSLLNDKTIKNGRNGYHNGLPKQHSFNNGKAGMSDIIKWEYKTAFLAIDSDVEVDEQIMEHIQKGYVNIFPANRETEDDEYTSDSELISIDKLNQLGEQGWEVITSIPKTKSILMMRRNGKPVSSVSGNITGAYIILKRPKR